jgi:nucleoside-diphosphate-sugar epimerase
MNILLAGAAGFIGCNLGLKFLDEGHNVFGVDNFITGQRQNIDKLSTRSGFRFIEQDITYPIEIKDKIDWIMNFASPASPPKYLNYPIETLRTNSEGTFNLLKLAIEKNSKFFLASTSEVYGDARVHPQPETYWGNVNPIGPRSVYDEGKRYAEALTMGMHRKYNVPIRIIRIFNTYGP